MPRQGVGGSGDVEAWHTPAPGGWTSLWMAHDGGPFLYMPAAEIAVPMLSSAGTSSFLGTWSLCPAITDFLPRISLLPLLGCELL